MQNYRPSFLLGIVEAKWSLHLNVLALHVFNVYCLLFHYVVRCYMVLYF